MHRIRFEFFIIVFSLLIFLPQTGRSQPGDPNDGNKPGIPVTGFEWLLLGGGLWGAKKIYDLRKKK